MFEGVCACAGQQQRARRRRPRVPSGLAPAPAPHAAPRAHQAPTITRSETTHQYTFTIIPKTITFPFKPFLIQNTTIKLITVTTIFIIPFQFIPQNIRAIFLNKTSLRNLDQCQVQFLSRTETGDRSARLPPRWQQWHEEEQWLRYVFQTH